MYEYNESNQLNQLNQFPEEIKENNKKKRGSRKVVKKAGIILFSAVLFGGAAGLTFEGVTNLKAGEAKTTENMKIDSDKLNLVKASAKASNTNTSTDGNMSVVDIAQEVMPSVVSITNKSVEEVESYYGMFGRGGFVTEQEIESAGSGIIIGSSDTELLLVSNNHVVENANTLTVGFADGSAAEAKVKGTDADNDLAVIAVSLEEISEETMEAIKVATIGNSADLQVGEQVVAIGNALGYGQSVTTGIVSAMDRQIDESEDSTKLIQTDTAINPGNSGGALINMRGEVIGINSAKFASTEIEGMGYAIPVDTASPILEDLMNRQTREKVEENQASSIGISGTDVSQEVQQQYGIPAGVYVSEINPGSAAEAAGIQKGNIITKFDGINITGINELKNQLQYYAAGETVEITLKVAEGSEYTEKVVEVSLDDASASSESSYENQEENWMQPFMEEGGYFGY